MAQEKKREKRLPNQNETKKIKVGEKTMFLKRSNWDLSIGMKNNLVGEIFSRNFNKNFWVFVQNFRKNLRNFRKI